MLTLLGRVGRVVLAAAIALLLVAAWELPAAAYVPITGNGSTWSQNAIEQWNANVVKYGMRVTYNGGGSTFGRNQFASEQVDFGVSEIPYGKDDGAASEARPKFDFAYMPIVAGGTAFMYNLKIGPRRVTNLRLSGDTVAKIFTNVITKWDDPAIRADNPGLTLPARKIVPVVRSDGSGTTAQFTLWMSTQYPKTWSAYCAKAGRNPCGVTSQYPVIPGSAMTAQAGSQNVSGYVAQDASVGTITYVEYSYAENLEFPVAKVRNAANYYIEPTAESVAVALLAARINTTKGPDYLTQDLRGVYAYADKRTYPLSSYSYMLVPVELHGTFSVTKGETLAAYAKYFLCEGQQKAKELGYSPLPINLVKAGMEQVRRIPGSKVASFDVATCNNPTFSKSGKNTLAERAPAPQECDKVGPTQCATGTGGAKQDTPSAGGSSGGTGNTGGTPAGGSGSGPSAGPGTSGNGTAAPPSGAVVDPDTGQVVGGAGAGAGGEEALAVPVSVATQLDPALKRVLVILACVLLAALTVGPPLVARLGRRRGSR